MKKSKREEELYAAEGGNHLHAHTAAEFVFQSLNFVHIVNCVNAGCIEAVFSY